MKLFYEPSSLHNAAFIVLRLFLEAALVHPLWVNRAADPGRAMVRAIAMADLFAIDEEAGLLWGVANLKGKNR